MRRKGFGRIGIFTLAALLLLAGCAAPDLAPAQVTPAPGAAYWEALSVGEAFERDMDGDGTAEKLTVFEGKVEAGQDAVFLSVQTGEEETLVPLMRARLFGAYYVGLPKLEPNKMLVVSAKLEGDAPHTAFYQVREGRPTEVARVDGVVASARHDGVVTLEDRFDILGTWYGARECALGPNMELTPIPQSLWMFDGASWPLYAKKPLPVKMENGDGTYADETLPAGTKLTLCAWDGESYVLFTLEDGAQGKLSYTGEPTAALLVDGTSAGEWLEDIVYTG